MILWYENYTCHGQAPGLLSFPLIIRPCNWTFRNLRDFALDESVIVSVEFDFVRGFRRLWWNVLTPHSPNPSDYQVNHTPINQLNHENFTWTKALYNLTCDIRGWSWRICYRRRIRWKTYGWEFNTGLLSLVIRWWKLVWIIWKAYTSTSRSSIAKNN